MLLHKNGVISSFAPRASALKKDPARASQAKAILLSFSGPFLLK